MSMPRLPSIRPLVPSDEGKKVAAAEANAAVASLEEDWKNLRNRRQKISEEDERQEDEGRVGS